MKRLRSLNRTITRWSTRLAPGARRPDYLGVALRNFGAAIRFRRHLARLAPRHFDNAVIDREQREQRERAARLHEIAMAIEKVYGTPPDLTSPPFTSGEQAQKGEEKVKPALREKVEFALAQYKLHLQLGRNAREQYERLRPHAVPTFGQIARLYELALAFGRIACGLSGE